MRLLSETIIEDVFAFCPPYLAAFSSLLLSVLPQTTSGIAIPAVQNHLTSTHDYQILILGGGVAGVLAAETLHHRGVDNFKIIEARSTLGGRMKSFSFGAPNRQYVLELGADWIHGTQMDDGPSNPIFDLALKHNLSSQPNHYRGSMTTYDNTGAIDYMQTFNTAVENFAALTVGGGERILRGLVDTTTRSGYSLLGAKPRTPHEVASEYYQFDWEYAQTPEQSSWVASSWVTYQSFIRQSRLLFRSEMIKSPTRSQIVLVCRIHATYLPHSRQIISPSTVTKAAFQLRTY